MNDNILVQVDAVSKKFCRSLKKSLWYGMKDMGVELTGGEGSHDRLRTDEFWAVNDVSFELRCGECLGLIGHNGAGKTTLLKMLNGLLKPDKGRIEMRGRIGAMIALGAGFNPILTGRENIYVNGSVLGLLKKEIDAKLDEIIDFAEIREFIDSPVQNYSSGMTVRLGFAIAAHCQPDILLLDEVLAVGDVGFQSKCFNTLAAFRRKGTGFIFVSHNMHQIDRYCDRVLYLRHGQTLFEGDPAEGIELFTRHMAEGQATDATGHTDPSKVYGSGKLSITSVDLLNQSRMPVTEVSANEPVILSLKYRCTVPCVEDPILDVVIRDRGGDLFQATNDSYAISFGNIYGSGAIEVRFDALPANNQRVLFFVTLLDRKTKETFDWKRNLPLYVHGRPRTQGRIDLACGWSMRRDSFGVAEQPGYCQDGTLQTLDRYD